ncbi:hypothetical protein GALL_301440 [mine drainage metagenome]|uniref:Uncharacterized protein n=1 Tax=mine drainage metagenome TaxID=410659 RepID=A0A1J5QW96_9ZZZZ
MGSLDAARRPSEREFALEAALQAHECSLDAARRPSEREFALEAALQAHDRFPLRCMKPMMPSGKNSTERMKISPITDIQLSVTVLA